jgi:hypothetical protein
MTTGLLAKKLINEIPEYYSKHIDTFKYIRQIMIRTASDSRRIQNEIEIIGQDDLSLKLYFKGIIDNKKYDVINLAIELANIPLTKSKKIITVLKLHLKQNSEYRPRVYMEGLLETTDTLNIGDVVLYKNNSNTKVSYYDRAKNDYFKIIKKYSFPEYLRKALTEDTYKDVTIEQDTVLFLGESLTTGETQFISSKHAKVINKDAVSKENNQFSCYIESTYKSDRNCLHFYMNIHNNNFSKIMNYKVPDREYFLPNDFIFFEGNVYFIYNSNYDIEFAKNGSSTNGVIYSCLNFVSQLEGALLSYSCEYLKYGQERYGSGSSFKGFHQYNIRDTNKYRFATKEEIMFYISIACQNHPKPL